MSLEFENNDDIIDESEITNNEQTFIITENDTNKRLDVFISEQLNITRSQIKNYLTSIIVNGAEKKLSYHL